MGKMKELWIKTQEEAEPQQPEEMENASLQD